MRKVLLVVFAASMILAGCGDSDKEVTKSENSGIQVQTLQDAQAEEETPTPTPTPTPEPTPTLQELVTVVCTGKSNVQADFMSGIYSDRCNLKFEITNNTDKPVQGIQGLLIVDDLFGSNIMKTTCNFTGQIIEPGETIENDSLGLDVNEFDGADVKLYNEKYEDLKFTYLVNSVVYADNESIAETNSTSGSRDVTIKCIGKKTIDADFYAGRINPTIQFIFSIENHTDKDIRGIQGMVTVSDLFGTVIDRFGCDFTGTTIKAGETTEISDKYLEAPSYENSKVKILNEDYEDLKFEYEVKDIVYAD